MKTKTQSKLISETREFSIPLHAYEQCLDHNERDPLPGGDVGSSHTRRRALRVENGPVRCVACGHRCLIAPGRRGICKVRFNEGGQLRVPFSYVAGGLASDPGREETVLPCLPRQRCADVRDARLRLPLSYCQNWVTSQALRDEVSGSLIVEGLPNKSCRRPGGAARRLVVSSYNEPLITAEWAVAVFQQRRRPAWPARSFPTATPHRALDFLRPWIVACKIDLKVLTTNGIGRWWHAPTRDGRQSAWCTNAGGGWKS